MAIVTGGAGCGHEGANWFEATNSSGYCGFARLAASPFSGLCSAGPDRSPLSHSVDVYRMLNADHMTACFRANVLRTRCDVATAADLLNGIPVEDDQYLLGHADPRAKRLYDRRQKQLTRNTIERLSI